MFTSDQLESQWKQMEEFGTSNFGLKFGPEFPAVAAILRESKKFMALGTVTQFLSALAMSGMQKQLQEAPDKDAFSKSLFEKPNTMHETLAEMFYLGYQMGRNHSEVAELEKLAMTPAVNG